METHSPEPSPSPTPDVLPGGWTMLGAFPSQEPFPGPDAPGVRVADAPPNAPPPGTVADSAR